MAKKPKQLPAETLPEVDLTKERVEKLTPIAYEILALITEAKLPIGDIKNESDESYNMVASKILAIMLREEVKYVDVDFLFQLVFQPPSIAKETVVLSLKHSFDQVINKSLHKEFRDVTLKDMDTILRTSDTIAVS